MGRGPGAARRPPPSPRAAQVPRRPWGPYCRGGSLPGPDRPVQLSSALPGPGGGIDSPQDQPKRPRGKPVGTAPVSVWSTRVRAARRGGQHGQPGGEGGAGERGSRDAPRGCAGGEGPAGQDGGCPDGVGRSLHPRGVDERRRQTPTRGRSVVGACPPPHGCIPGPGGARRGRPESGGGGRCPVQAAVEHDGVGPCPMLGLWSRAAAEGGEGSGEGAGSCSAAMQRRAESRARRPGSARRPTTAAMRVWAPRSAGGPNRTGPGRASRSPPGRPPSQLRRVLALPRFLAPVSFSSRSCRHHRTFPPAAARSLGSSRSPCVCRGGGAHPAPGAGRPRATPAGHTVPPNSSASRCGSPRRRDRCGALIRSRFSWGKFPLPYVTSAPSPGTPTLAIL